MMNPDKSVQFVSFVRLLSKMVLSACTSLQEMQRWPMHELKTNWFVRRVKCSEFTVMTCLKQPLDSSRSGKNSGS